MSSLLANFKLSSLTFVLALALAGCGGAPASDTGTDPGTDPGAGDGDDGSVQIGSGGGSSFVSGAADADLQSSGTDSTASWDVSVVVVGSDNLAVTDTYSVSFTSTCVQAGLASLDNSTVDTVAGRASVTYSSGSCTGVDTVVASISTGASATADLDIDANTDSSGGGTGTLDPTVRIGSGSGVGFVEGDLSAGSTTLQAGGSTTISANLVDEDGELITQSTTVSFSSDCVSDGLASFSQSSAASSNGVAVTTFTANGCVGLDTITATATSSGDVITADVDVTVSADTVSSIEFVSITDPILSLPGTGGTETTNVYFQVNGELGAPVPGESVSFSLSSSVGGVALLPSRLEGISDEQGRVFTTIQSGTVSTTVSVVAMHNSTGNQTTSDGIVITSGVPVNSKFSLSVEDFAPRDAYNTDGISVNVGVIVSDYFGNDVPDGLQVFFASPESGNIDASCTLESGECSVSWISASPRPSDLRATIIAFIDGAEDFTDTNGNNVYDPDDIFTVDIGEPFIDENEDGVFTAGEYFRDSNGNGSRDVGNGIWDGPCLSAINNTADCSGEDSIQIFKRAIITMPTEEPRILWAYYRDDSGTYYRVDDFDSPNEEDRTVYTGDGGRATLTIAISDATEVPSAACEEDFPHSLGPDPAPCGNSLPFQTVVNARILDSGEGRLDGQTRVSIDRSVLGRTQFELALADTEEGVDFRTDMEILVELGTETLGVYYIPVVFGPRP